MGRLRPRRAIMVAVGSLTVALFLGGCAGQEQSGTPAQQVSTWMRSGAGGSGIGNVEIDSKNVDLALSQHNKPAAIKEVCALLSNDAQSAIGNLPTPDDQLTTALNTAYQDATAAGNDCYNGANGDTRLQARSASERKKLFTLLGVAVQRATAVMGQTPTTDTTVPPTGGGDPFAGGS
jgi:hypothetical protein